MSGEDDVAFRLLHTGDWHLGKRFPTFDESAERTLRRARLDVLEEVFAAATRNKVDAVLCAGDLFDEPKPDTDWWRGLLGILKGLPPDFPPMFMLPGNHDPLLPDSVWSSSHPFRSALPGFVHVVDREDFQKEINPGLVLYAVPCFSKAGASDPVEKIPPRVHGDESVRVGLVHGSTFEVANCEMNFPIRPSVARDRGLDYLAIGDTHGYREVQDNPPVVYCGAPEPTAFDEVDPGQVVLVCFTRVRGRPLLRKVPVAHWTWRDKTIHDLATLRSLVHDDLDTTVLRLAFDIDVDLRDRDEIEQILGDLAGNEARHGRAGILEADRTGIRIDVSSASDAFPQDLSPVLLGAVDDLRRRADGGDPDVARRARIALYKLSTLTRVRSVR
jgi:DNA repair exonuclease SbcCD nuclease subunit